MVGPTRPAALLKADLDSAGVVDISMRAKKQFYRRAA
jgi:hypothetical protein